MKLENNEAWDRLEKDLKDKIKTIRDLLKDKTVVIAFSGGLDSSLVTFFAKMYAKRTCALTVRSEAIPSVELENAKIIANKLGVPLEFVHLKISKMDGVQKNQQDRCYRCKKQILSTLIKHASKSSCFFENQENFKLEGGAQKIDIFADGTNYSDLDAVRPGLKALNESKFVSPLALAKISKEEVRQLSNHFDLPSKNIPSQACLASRVPFGTPLNTSLLSMIDEAESTVRAILGNKNVHLRVRVHRLNAKNDFMARIELEKEVMVTLFKDQSFEKIEKKLREIGFTYVCLDLRGFRSGSMHDLI